MKNLFLLLTLVGIVGACSDAGGVDPDAIPEAQKRAVWMALDSAFRHDTTLDPAFTGDSGLYVLMSTVVIPFVDRASRIGLGADTTQVVGIEFDIDATQNGAHVDGVRDSPGDRFDGVEMALTRRAPAHDVQSVRVRSKRVDIQRGPRHAQRRVHDQREIGSRFDYDGDVGLGLWQRRAGGEDQNPRHATLSERSPAPSLAPTP